MYPRQPYLNFFPYTTLFRSAKKINEEMKLAAVYALANLAKESVPEQVNIAYGERRLVFGRDYLLPKPFDPRLITEYHLRSEEHKAELQSRPQLVIRPLPGKK